MDKKSLPFHKYQEAEDMIMAALPMFQRLGNAALKKLDLSKTTNFLSYLGNPHLDFRSIHIAGTNGKGSVSHMIAAVCQQHGYKTGLFTSPHLKSYRERIRLNGQCIDEKFILDWVNKHAEYLIENELSFFEMSMGLASSYFSAAKVDIAIMETGMGGRLDATNVLYPILSIITHIGMDHQQYLGDTQPKIAYEKAGIIKSGIPVLLGNNMDPELYPVFAAVAEKNNAPLLFSQPAEFSFLKTENENRVYYFTDPESNGKTFALPTLAPYQDYNVNTAWHACLYLHRSGILPLTKTQILQGLGHFQKLTGFQGRYEIIHREPLIIADTAHNVAGLEFYNPLFENNNVHLHLVLALTKEKNVQDFLSYLPKSAIFYFCQPDVPRALSAKDLQKEAGKMGIKGEVWASPQLALKEIILKANKEDIGLIFGSIFLVAEIL